MTAQLLATAIAMPRYRHAQADIRERLLAWLAHDPALAGKAASIVDNGQVRTRHTVRPLDWYLEHASVTERSQVYRDEMIDLCQSACQQALQA
ncbi:MAG TPA: hypothetical protein VL359_07135, partial [bacterium]|nr:hypothetical protein [bacterium]